MRTGKTKTDLIYEALAVKEDLTWREFMKIHKVKVDSARFYECRRSIESMRSAFNNLNDPTPQRVKEYVNKANIHVFSNLLYEKIKQEKTKEPSVPKTTNGAFERIKEVARSMGEFATYEDFRAAGHRGSRQAFYQAKKDIFGKPFGFNVDKIKKARADRGGENPSLPKDPVDRRIPSDDLREVLRRFNRFADMAKKISTATIKEIADLVSSVGVGGIDQMIEVYNEQTSKPLDEANWAMVILMVFATSNDYVCFFFLGAGIVAIVWLISWLGALPREPVYDKWINGYHYSTQKANRIVGRCGERVWQGQYIGWIKSLWRTYDVKPSTRHNYFILMIDELRPAVLKAVNEEEARRFIVENTSHELGQKLLHDWFVYRNT